MSFVAKSLVPVPLPGECVYSIAAAFARHWFQGERRGASLLFGGSTPTARDIPARLAQVARSLPASLRMDALQLALRHTALPIHLPFVDEARRAALLRAVDAGQAMQFRLGIAPAQLTCTRTMRLCPTCAHRDRQRFGRAYWHREHQLPGVLTCPTHGCPLVHTSVRPEQLHASATFMVPDQARVVSRERLSPKERVAAHQLSREMAHLLRSDSPRPGPVRLHSYYRHLLHSAGYAQPNGSIAVTRLSADLTSHYGHSFLQRVRCLPGGHSGWVAALVRKPRSHQQPLRHLLLLSFLGRSVDQLGEALAFDPVQRASKPHPFRIKDRSRLIRLRSQMRRAWLQVVKRRQTRSRRDLAVYAWLHRNDRTWLRTIRAPRMKRTADTELWARRDTNLAGKIPGLAQRIMREGPTRRASRNAIASRSGATAWLVRDHPRLPQATAAIKKAAESAMAFAIRRIQHVASRPRFIGPIPVWKLRTLAGISTALARKKAVAAALYESANNICPGASFRAERKR